MENGKVQCRTCNRWCVIAPAKKGFCETRENRDGILYTLEYGLVSSLSINPIEKKPLYHFYPGGKFLTVGSYSCTFTCPWCQNHEITKTAPKKRPWSRTLSPEDFVSRAVFNHCTGTSMSFSEPTTFLEYAVDVFSLAREEGLVNTCITNGYFTPEARELLLENCDAFNIDIKGNATTYEEYCNADGEKVWENVRIITQKAHVGLTTLVIPEVNDNDECLHEIAARISRIDPEIPWHISRYFPDYEFSNPRTPIDTLERAYKIGKGEGLQYVYIGNVPGHRYESTYCPFCGEQVVQRRAYVIKVNLEGNTCPQCGETIPIVGLT